MSGRIAQVVSHQLERGWLERDSAGRLQVSAEGEPWMAYWRAQLRPVLEGRLVSLLSTLSADA